jgi:dynactin 1
MEKDIICLDDLQCRRLLVNGACFTHPRYPAAQYESSLIQLTNAETQVENLKEQLDDALGAEEMLVQLTERNLMLGEVSALRP